MFQGLPFPPQTCTRCVKFRAGSAPSSMVSPSLTPFVHWQRHHWALSVWLPRTTALLDLEMPFIAVLEHGPSPKIITVSLKTAAFLFEPLKSWQAITPTGVMCKQRPQTLSLSPFEGNCFSPSQATSISLQSISLPLLTPERAQHNSP